MLGTCTANGNPRRSRTWLRNIRIASVVLIPSASNILSASSLSSGVTRALTTASFMSPNVAHIGYKASCFVANVRTHTRGRQAELCEDAGSMNPYSSRFPKIIRLLKFDISFFTGGNRGNEVFSVGFLSVTSASSCSKSSNPSTIERLSLAMVSLLAVRYGVLCAPSMGTVQMGFKSPVRETMKVSTSRSNSVRQAAYQSGGLKSLWLSNGGSYIQEAGVMPRWVRRKPSMRKYGAKNTEDSVEMKGRTDGGFPNREKDMGHVQTSRSVSHEGLLDG